MNKILNNIQPTSERVETPAKKLNFRATAPLAQHGEMDYFIKSQKQAKKQQNLNTGIQVAVLGVLGLSVGLMMKQMGMFKKFKLEFKDLTKEKSIEEMALPESLRKTIDKISSRIENYSELLKKGGKEGSAILFYGPPGTGKNTFAYGITKKFPNAKLVDLDISKMNSKWHGESEQNILGTMKAIIKEAQKNPKNKYFVFIDEIDSVMMLDKSSGSKLSNDVLNAFKKGFNELTNKENIIVMGATNLKIDPKLAMAEGKQLDTAMLDRFAQKVLVDLPTKEQILSGIEKFYNNSKRAMVDESLKDIKNPKWEKIADFLAQKEHQTSFRKLTSILGEAAEISPKGKDVTFEHIIQAIQDNQHNLHISDAELQKFLNTIK